MSALLVCSPFLLVACAQSGVDPTLTRHDFAVPGGNMDLAGADLAGADLSVTDSGVFDGGADMSRTTWSDKSFTTTNTLWSIWSNGNGVVYVVGDANTRLISAAGSAFAQDSSSAPSTTVDFLSIAGASTGPPGNPLYMAGRAGTIWSYSNNLAAMTGTWAADSTANTGTADYSTIWVASDGTVFACGNAFCKKKSGGTYSDVTGAATDQVFGLWGWKTGAGYVVWAAGAGGKIWKSTGTTFAAQTSGVTTALYGVYGFSDMDVYAVGDVGVVLHTTNGGTTWTKQTVTGVTTALNAIGGASADEVYAVGDNGVVLHKYGAASSTWVKETLGLGAAVTNASLLAIWADVAQVWVAGASGVIIKK